MNKEYFAQITNFEINTESLAGIFEAGAFIITAFIVITFSILSLILDRHWREHGVTKKQIRILRQVYYGISGILLLLMLISLILFIL